MSPNEPEVKFGSEKAVRMTIGNDDITDVGQMFTEITYEVTGDLHKVVLYSRYVPRVVATF